MTTATKIQTAYNLGIKGANNDKKAPAQCKECLSLICDNTKENIEIMKSWNKGFQFELNRKAIEELKSLGVF